MTSNQCVGQLVPHLENQVPREDVKHGELLQELHSRGYFLDADITAYGRLEAGDLGAGDAGDAGDGDGTVGPIEGIGLSSNLKTRDRAFALAMSLAILLRLEPGTANMICNNFGVGELLHQACSWFPSVYLCFPPVPPSSFVLCWFLFLFCFSLSYFLSCILLVFFVARAKNHAFRCQFLIRQSDDPVNPWNPKKSCPIPWTARRGSNVAYGRWRPSCPRTKRSFASKWHWPPGHVAIPVDFFASSSWKKSKRWVWYLKMCGNRGKTCKSGNGWETWENPRTPKFRKRCSSIFTMKIQPVCCIPAFLDKPICGSLEIHTLHGLERF